MMTKAAQEYKWDFVLKADARGVFRFKQQGGFDTWSSGDSGHRELLLRTIPSGCQYTFVSTVANPAAIDALLREHEKEEHRAKDRDFLFDAGLMQTYLNALARVAQEKGIADVSYHLVECSSAGSHPHWEAAQWPVMHVIPSQQEDRFRTIAHSLNTIGYKQVLAMEKPQNYRLPQVDFLRNHGISPLRAEKHVTVGGDTLVQLVNVLLPFSYSRNEHSGSED